MRRFALAPALAANRAPRRAARALAWGFWTVYFLFVLAILSLRYAILPDIENYRPLIERLAGDGLGQKVSIGRIEASWDGINPDLTLRDVSLADAEGRPTLAFSRVEAVLSWWSVVEMRPRLRVLRIDRPTLRMRRDADGRLFVAGMALGGGSGENAGNGGSGGSGGAPWAFGQRRIRVAGATLFWEDALRGAPALVLRDVDIAIDNDGGRHRFGITARPPENLASRIDVRGDFLGGDFGAPDTWRGQAFVEIERADLAAWSRWVDYPVALPRGRGAARAWLAFAGGGLREATADVALRDSSLRFAEDLPELELDSASGRLRANFQAGGFALSGRGVALSSRKARGAEGGPLRVEPTDFDLEWRAGRDAGVRSGSAGINHADLGTLARLAAYLPLDARTRQALDDHAPRGQIGALAARWSGGADGAREYSLKAELRDLGLRAKGLVPGFSGITGAFEATEKGGRVTLNSGKSSLDLPAVFPEPLIQLDSLNVQASWKIDRNVLEVELARADFAGPEAAGSAKGKYRATGDGPGVIDMTAALTRADARAVWRYLPHAVGRDARLWLRDSLLAGQATEARLVLKGDLKDFPFLDERLGRFLVTVKARDAILDYGEGWPRIEAIQGDLRFEGSGMTIEARQGRILDARLGDTRVWIPDFDAQVPLLFVKGQADGPTAEFLKFIDRSPVAGWIDHFTQGMRATGAGHLDIDLTIPLDESRLGESKVAGAYRFTNDELTVDAALPPLRQVNGSLRFSGRGLDVPEIDAALFGGPLKIRGGTQKDGRVLMTVDGLADMERLRRQSPHPALAGLSGTVPYRGEIRIDGRNADIVVESDLVGLASTLPEPFAKAAGETLPLRFEKRLLPTPENAARTDAAIRDQIGVSLGSLLEARIVRRKTADGFAPERGAVAIGRPLRLPEKGFALGVTAKRLNLDAWRGLFDAAASGGQEQGEAASAWLPDAINLRVDELLASGMSWNDVDLSAAPIQEQWKIQIDSRQASGKLTWLGAGGGRLVARLGRLAIERLSAQSGTDAGAPTRQLPALDIVADDFSVRQLKFGRIELQASNDGAGWNLHRIQASNPHGALTGEGLWRQEGGGGRTQLSFRLDSGDVGGLLARLGYPGAVRAGTAQLDGKLSWAGAPTEIDYASMDGELNLTAAKGQFLKLDPGAAGKLLGLVSLRNLPRRISLDFKDVFSEGLAFDAIAGKMTVRDGVMQTRRLRIDSPSAQIVMRGEVDLTRETQRLDVTVWPEVGETAAVGVALLNPVAGAATWLASKVLRRPLGAMFGYRYSITGAWDDPKVEKLDATAAETENPPEAPDDPVAR
ncbi:MAG: TIGR02099 family protein [Candidatus Accumulibacter sp.]|nr:TIGR02099 family protein [Accumulibacter sp.]